MHERTCILYIASSVFRLSCLTLYSIDSFKFTCFIILFKCSSQERLWVRIMPRCLWLWTLSTGLLLKVKGGWSLIAFLEKTRSLVFPVLKVTFHFLAQSETFTRSLLSRLDVSWMSVPLVIRVVSSAKIWGVDSRSLMISFMKRMKRSGPSLEPCGTPAFYALFTSKCRESRVAFTHFCR